MVSKKRKIISGIGVDTIGSFLAQGVGFLVVPFYLSFISPDRYGLFLAINGFIGMLAILDFPIEQYLTSMSATDDFFSKNFNRFFSFSLAIKVGISILYFIVGNLIIYFFDDLFGNIDQLLVYVQLLLFAALFNGVTSIFHSILNGRNHFALSSGINSVTLLFQTLFPLFFLLHGLGIESFFLGYFLSSLFSCVASCFFVKTNVRSLRLDFRGGSLDQFKDVLSFSSSFQAIRWLHLFRTQLVLVLINKILGGSFATVYSMSNRLPLTFSGYSGKISLPFFPIFSEMHAKGEVLLIKQHFLRLFEILSRLSISLFILGFFFNSIFVSLWVGESLVSSNSTMVVILLSMSITILFSCFGIVLFGLRDYGLWPLFAIVEMLLVIVCIQFFHDNLFNLTLSFLIGLIFTCSYLCYYVLKKLNITYKQLIKRLFLHGFFPGIVLLIVILLCFEMIDTSSWQSLIYSGIFILTLSLLFFDLPKFIYTRRNRRNRRRIL